MPLGGSQQSPEGRTCIVRRQIFSEPYSSLSVRLCSLTHDPVTSSSDPAPSSGGDQTYDDYVMMQQETRVLTGVQKQIDDLNGFTISLIINYNLLHNKLFIVSM